MPQPRTPRRPFAWVRANAAAPGLLLLLLAAAAVLAWRFFVPRSVVARGPILLVSIDTLRADRLPVYGYTGIQTPAIDALASDGIAFERAYAHSPLTLPSHASMLSGRLPFEHGVRDNVGFVLDASVPWMPEMLGNAGFATGAVVSSYVLRRGTGLNRGFAYYDDDLPGAASEAGMALVQRDGTRSLDAALRWLDANLGRRAFLFFHIYEPHTPYAPPAPYPQSYDGEIAYADTIVGNLIGALRERQLYDDAAIVLTSDHGEGLGDHGEAEHGIFLYDEMIRVPLIVKLPGGRGERRRVRDPVQHIDLVPTLLDLAAVQTPTDLPGRSLRGLLTGARGSSDGREAPTARGSPAEHPIYAESLHPRYQFGWSELYALTDARYRYILAPREELYDLLEDPGERRNIAAGRPQTADAMRAALQLMLADRGVDRPAVVPAEERERLQALGYVGMQIARPPHAPAGARPDPKDRIHLLERDRRATALAGRRQFEDAIAEFRGLLAEAPDMLEVWHKLAEVLVRAGRHAEAAAAYRRALDLRAGDAGAAAGAASALLVLGRLDEAQALAERAVGPDSEGDPRTRALAYGVLVQIALTRPDPAAARRAAARAQAADPRLPMVAFVEGLVRYRAGRYADALPFFEDALAKRGDPSPMVDLHFHLGDTLARLERYDEAERQFHSELRLFPHNLRARATLATLYEATGRRAEAARQIEGLTAVAPTPEGYALAARLWTMFGEPARAAEMRAKARAPGAR